MKYRQSKIRGKMRGFTILELMIAAALLALLLILVTSLTSHTSTVSANSQRRMTADSEGRQALDRISEDFSRAFFREDLSENIVKVSGNDEIAFYAQTAGYDGDRGVSRIGYRVGGTPVGLLRGAEGLSWTGTNQVVFNGTIFGAIADTNEELLAKDIFRFEIAFLKADGTLVAFVPDLKKSSGVVAVLVGIAALDPQMRDLTEEDLGTRFPDAVDGRDILSLWTETMNLETFRTGVPKPAINAIRIYQRMFPLR